MAAPGRPLEVRPTVAGSGKMTRTGETMSRELTITHRDDAVQAEMTTSAAPARVWRAWAEPEILSQWFTDRARGRASAGATMTWIFDRFRMELPYDVVIADPERRLVLKGSPVGRPPYLLEIVMAPSGDGTRLTVINSGFTVGSQLEEQRDGVHSGWSMALVILKHYLENHFGQERETFFAMQPAPFSYDQVLPRFLTAAGLSRWLTRDGAIGEPGEPYRLTLSTGETMSGRVLVVTSSEVALTWDEIGGVVELKAFLLGPRTRAVSVRGCGWDLSADRAAEIEQMMAAAVDRLVADLADLADQTRSVS